LRKSGAFVKTPVWFAAADGKLYVFTAGASGKVKRIRNFSRVRLAPCDVRGNIRGEWCDAKARIVDDQSVAAPAYAALRAKYGFQMWLTDLGARLTGRIAKRALIEIEL
jgi:PPOX class probable F420-dependent enzyme